MKPARAPSAASQDLTLLARLCRSAIGAKDLRPFLEAAVQSAASALGADAAAIFDHERERSLRLRIGFGMRSTGGILQLAYGPDSDFGHAIRDGEPLLVDCTRKAPYRISPLHAAQGFQGALLVPLAGAEDPTGFLTLHFHAPPRLPAPKVEFARAVANLAAAAIDRARVEEELVRHHARLEELVEERTRQLAESNRELDAFNYTVSHDLRGPLRAVSGYSALLEQRLGERLEEQDRTILQHLRKGANRMSELLDELLNLSRYTQRPLKPERIDLTATAREIVAELRRQEPQREVHVDIQEGMEAEGDPQLVGVVLENLLSNAWKFTARKALAHIEFGADERDGQLAFYVRDNGAGFDKSQAHRLFQPFNRLHTEKEFPGNGVGLATVRRIVARHSGRVWVDATLDHGTTFHFTLGEHARAPPTPQAQADPALVR